MHRVVLVTGQRSWDDLATIWHVLTQLKPTVLIEGEAKGADLLARNWAQATRTHFIPMPADWDAYGYSAGPIRNREMLAQLECFRQLGDETIVVGFLDEGKYGPSSGTVNCLDQARRKRFATRVITTKDPACSTN